MINQLVGTDNALVLILTHLLKWGHFVAWQPDVERDTG